MGSVGYTHTHTLSLSLSLSLSFFLSFFLSLYTPRGLSSASFAVVPVVVPGEGQGIAPAATSSSVVSVPVLSKRHTSTFPEIMNAGVSKVIMQGGLETIRQ